MKNKEITNLFLDFFTPEQIKFIQDIVVTGYIEVTDWEFKDIDDVLTYAFRSDSEKIKILYEERELKAVLENMKVQIDNDDNINFIDICASCVSDGLVVCISGHVGCFTDLYNWGLERQS